MKRFFLEKALFLPFLAKNLYLCTTMPRHLLIVNPISGTHSKKGLTEQIEARLAAAGIEVVTYFTTAPGDATRRARLAVDSGEFDAVLACGGDGTVNEVARAMCHAPIPMGIIPAGSGNGLARHIVIPIDPLRALDTIIDDVVTDCDYAEVNGKPFFCTFGIGFDAAVSDRFAASGKRGRMSYVQSTIAEFRHYRPEHYTIETPDGTIEREAFLIAVCNASQYGNNAFIAPQASITDGLLDVIVIHKASALRTMLLGVDMMAGLLRHNRLAETIRTPRVTITRGANAPAHIDGEPAPNLGATLSVDCIHRGIKIFTQKDKSPFRPIVSPLEYYLRDLAISLHIK